MITPAQWEVQETALKALRFFGPMGKKALRDRIGVHIGKVPTLAQVTWACDTLVSLGKIQHHMRGNGHWYTLKGLP